ncbi:putative ammonium transporter 1 [Corticium candelabrum]|uniref:putative ammonium transporter 1 n=1 Tax=Corticium candelabrum TaxID=121492 RepID=UPI002E26F3DC|nr:putative ammonium transporter 1 [Corticium candelabrum]
MAFSYELLCMTTLGGFIILFGFFAFNLLSTGDLSKPNTGGALGLIAVNCIMAASGGSLTSLIYRRFSDKVNQKWSLVSAINGSLAGLVSISACANSVYSYCAFVIGMISGVVYSFVAKLVEGKRLDDPLDAIAVHFGGGVCGILCVPFLDANMGLFYKGNKVSMVLLGWNLCGLLVITVWTLMWASLIFGIMSWLNILRVTSYDERKGLDIVKHGERAYPYQVNIEDRSSSLTLCEALTTMYSGMPTARNVKHQNSSHNKVQKATGDGNAADQGAKEEAGVGSSRAVIHGSDRVEIDPVSVV